MNEAPSGALDAWDDELSDHGLLPAHARRAIGRSASLHVVRPLLTTLLGRALAHRDDAARFTVGRDPSLRNAPDPPGLLASFTLNAPDDP